MPSARNDRSGTLDQEQARLNVKTHNKAATKTTMQVECAYPNLIPPALSVVTDHPVWRQTILIAHSVLQTRPAPA